MKKTKKKKIKKSVLFKGISLIVMAFSLIVFIFLIRLQMIPFKYLILIFIVLLLLDVFLYLLLSCKNYRLRILGTLLSILLVFSFSFILYYQSVTESFLKNISFLNIQTETYYVLVLKESNYESLDDLSSKEVDYLESKNTVNEQNAYSSEIIARVGLYNTGYLSSETDNNTYQRIDRTESLKWQNFQTKYTIFGGIVKNWKSTYNDLENAINDMKNRHCTYLDKDEEQNVKEKWKNTLYIGSEELYNRQNGYIYIQNHLGYRLLLTNAEIKGTEAGKPANISINLENIGFGNIIKEKKTSIIYKNSKNTYKVETNIDIRKQLKDNNYILKINEDIPEYMENGEYDVYLSIGEPYETLENNSNYYIKLANKNLWSEETKGNYLGKVTIGTNANKNGSNSTDTINQVADNQGNTINSKIIIGSVVGILVIIVLIIIIIIKKKKDTDLLNMASLRFS